MPFQFNFSGGSSGFLILFVIIINVVIASFASHIASEKGHDPVGWFLLGFFGGIVALAIICAVPNQQPGKSEDISGYITEQLYRIDDHLREIDKKLSKIEETKKDSVLQRNENYDKILQKR